MKIPVSLRLACIIVVLVFTIPLTSCLSDDKASESNAGKTDSSKSAGKTAQDSSQSKQNNSSTTDSTVKTISTSRTTLDMSDTIIHPTPDKITLVTSADVDLNGDGAKDSISVSGSPNDPQNPAAFALRINGSSVTGEFDGGESFDGFAIVDINKGDKYKEIAVHSPGPSDDDEYFIYWYNGSTINEVGQIGRWPKFTGNGIVYVDGWVSFWQNTDKYVLTKQRKLQLVPQPFYYVGIKSTVKKSFPLFASPGSKSIVANVREGSRIFIVLCDMSSMSKNDYDFWYMVRSESNLVGWVRESGITSNTDLPVAD